MNKIGYIVNVLERFYTESHEWVLLSDDKSSATIGISDHAQVSQDK